MTTNEVKQDERIIDIVSIVKIEPATSEFYLTKGGFVGLKKDGKDEGRVLLLRMTPFSNEDCYISVRNMDQKEIGIVERIADFPAVQQDIVNKELAIRYFTPVIKEITSISEEYGFTFIKADTEAGKREFAMRDLSNNIIFLTASKALLVDTDGNRYLVPELKKLSDKAMRIIGVWA